MKARRRLNLIELMAPFLPRASRYGGSTNKVNKIELKREGKTNTRKEGSDSGTKLKLSI